MAIVKRKLVALRPAGVCDDAERSDWFYRLYNPLWYRDLAYYKFSVPSEACPLGHKGLAVLGYLCSRAKHGKAPRLTYSYIAGKVGIDYRTVAATLITLAEHGFIRHERQQAGEVFTVPIIDPEAVPGWFVAAKVSETPTCEPTAVGRVDPDAWAASNANRCSEAAPIPGPGCVGDHDARRYRYSIGATLDQILADYDPRKHAEAGRVMLERALDSRYGTTLDADTRKFILAAGGGSPMSPSIEEYLTLTDRYATAKEFIRAVEVHFNRRREALLR